MDELRCFVAVCATLNFRVASAAVFLTPSALSVRVQNLESLLGVRLFERTTRQVRVTEAGERLLPIAREILELAERCAEIANGHPARSAARRRKKT